MRTNVLLTILAGVLAVALVAATVLVVQSRRQLSQVRGQLENLQQRVQPTETGSTEQPTDGATSGAGGLLESLRGQVPGAACLAELAAGAGQGGGGSAPAETQALVDHIAREVAQLRELEVQQDIDAQLLSAEQTAERVGELFLEDYSPARAETERRLLTTLGAVEEGTDLRSLYRELLSGQVAGFYVPSTGELAVRRAGREGLGPTDRVILAHEIDHALTDQVLGLPTGGGGPGEGGPDSDAELSATAVVEGDASLVMQGWALRNLGFAEQLQLATDPSALAAAGDLQQAPHYFAERLTFPYLDGLGFVCDVYRDGGWEAVNALYDDPPTSTAQVMFPERYLQGDGASAPPRLDAPPGWQRRTTDSFGAAQLSWLLEAPGGVESRSLSNVRSRVRAWAGGSATVWEDGSASAVGLSFLDGGSEPALCGTITSWYGAAFPQAEATGGAGSRNFDGAGQDAAVRCSGGQVTVGIAPQLPAAQSIAE